MTQGELVMLFSTFKRSLGSRGLTLLWGKPNLKLPHAVLHGMQHLH